MEKYRHFDNDLPLYYNNTNYSLSLNSNEQKLLEDLILFERQAEKIFFSENFNKELLDMIDDTIDNKLEKSLDKECALDPKLKEDLSSSKLVELIEKIDKVLEKD